MFKFLINKIVKKTPENFNNGNHNKEKTEEINLPTLKRNISIELVNKINRSTLPFFKGALYMHYFDELLEENFEDQTWQNQNIYFWDAFEIFPKKSLPPFFESLPKKYFIIISNSQIYKQNQGEVIPWFGMPGTGIKYFFTNNNNEVQIAELNGKKIIRYVELINFNDLNSEVLNDRENYLIFINENILELKNNKILFNKNIISLSYAYSIGGIEIIKIV